MATTETGLNKVKNKFEQLKNDDEKDNEAFAASQKKFEAISIGMEINNDGKAETLQEQLINARSAAAQAKSEQQQAIMKLKYCQEQLREKEKEFAANTADTNGYKIKISEAEREIKVLEVSYLLCVLRFLFCN